MRFKRFVLSIAAVVVVALALPRGVLVLEGQEREGGNSVIASLTEPGEGLTIRSTSRLNGLVTFASSQRRGVFLNVDATATAEERVLTFVDSYGGSFGVSDRSQLLLQRATVDQLGVSHVRFQQVHRGVPVTGAEFVVHLKGPLVTAANGQLVSDLPDDVTPTVAPRTAIDAAHASLQKREPGKAGDAQYGAPRLEIFNRGIFEGTGFASRLAWFIEAKGDALWQYTWVDAKTGAVLLSFSQLPDALNRSIYTANEGGTLPGTLIRSEGGPATGDVDADLAYDFAGITYNYYLTNHGRDSYNGAGAPLPSTVHYCPANTTCPYQNAFWNGSRMVYGTGFAAGDDVVAHELTHAVTSSSANLFYYMQSGALNESFSDIFGETVDQGDGRGNDTAGVRWLMGEDLSIGAIRNMMDPPQFGDPGKMTDIAQFKCDAGSDHGGVHSNSGVPNHAYALMVDGGTYNGRTVTGIGSAKAAKIEYRALTIYLTSGSNFIDDFNALNQSCVDLIGTVGITSADCGQVNNALLAVEMSSTWSCAGSVPTPPVCPVVGNVPLNIFFDNFEAMSGNWTATSTSSAQWTPYDSTYSKTGTGMASGEDPNMTSDHSLAMTNAVTLPAGARLFFDHAFGFESPNFDGGVIEYSTNNGTTWTDAASLIEAGRTYTGTIASGSGNPLGARAGFVNASFGYTGTRLNLASLAGQSFKFRFRIGSDVDTGELGWVVDNFRIYQCGGGTPSPPTNLVGLALGTTRVQLTWTASAGATSYNVKRGSVSGGETLIATGVTGTTYTDTSVTRGVYYYVVSAVAGSESPNSNEARVKTGNYYADFDGDGKSDITIFRPSTGQWFVRPSSTFVPEVLIWGGGSDKPVPGDYDGDGIIDVAVFRPSTGEWFVRQSSTFTLVTLVWGGGSDIPVQADYDGDGKTDVAIFRPSTGEWFVRQSSTFTPVVLVWGGGADKPVPGDYDGDGKADVAVFRPSTGEWFIRQSSTFTLVTLLWGGGSDKPVPGDYDGDGKFDIAVFRPTTGEWFVRQSSTFTLVTLLWGGGADIPLPGDYDGDGKMDITVFRPSTGEWFIRQSTTFTLTTIVWGGGSDIPIP